ncbi:MAG: hypothetical protein ABGZ35_01460 [Planctomycetaceae bacterium]|jgi:hypothetical protein
MNRKQFLLPALARELPKADRLNSSRLLASYDRASVAETVDCEAVAGGATVVSRRGDGTVERLPSVAGGVDSR